MDPTHPLAWISVLAIGGGALAMLHVVASALKQASQLHDLKVEAIRLHVLYRAQIHALDVGFDPDRLPQHDQHAMLRFITSGEIDGVEIGEETTPEDGEEIIDVSTVASINRSRRAA